MNKIILLAGGIVTLVLAILWYLNIISEPLVAIGSAIITVLSSIVVPKKQEKKQKVVLQQNHSGSGDNVAGDKTVNN